MNVSCVFRTVFIVLFSLVGFCAHVTLADIPDPESGTSDRYSSFRELLENESKSAYRITVRTPSRCKTTVLAIHGGRIENGTSELARLIAKDDFNLYLFEGVDPARGNFRMHITSSHFDEPLAIQLVSDPAKTRQCVSIHGFKSEIKQICLGGLNRALKAEFVAQAKSADLKYEVVECSALRGNEPANIVNRCAGSGIQLELSSALRRDLLGDSGEMNRLAETIRHSLTAPLTCVESDE